MTIYDRERGRGRERETERERERSETETECERERETHKERARERKRERERARESRYTLALKPPYRGSPYIFRFNPKSHVASIRIDPRGTDPKHRGPCLASPGLGATDS